MCCVLASAAPALADDGRFSHNVECSATGCTAGAHSPPREPPPPRIRPSESASTGSGPECVVWDEEFARSGLEGPQEVPRGAARCSAVLETAAEAGFDPAALAERMRAAMRPPGPDIGTAPPLGRPRFVNMPSWMWVDEGDWAPVSATASVSAGR